MPPVGSARKPWLLRQWWRITTFLYNAARALLTPLRGVLVSMGYRQNIADNLNQMPRVKRSTLSTMRKDELMNLAGDLGIATYGHETNYALREAIRQKRPPETHDTRRGSEREKFIARYSDLRKGELVTLAGSLGLDTSGVKDALVLRLKGWASTPGPIPPGAPSAKCLIQQRASSAADSSTSAPAAAAASVPSSSRASSQHMVDVMTCPAGHGEMKLKHNQMTGLLEWRCTQPGCPTRIPHVPRRPEDSDEDWNPAKEQFVASDSSGVSVASSASGDQAVVRWMQSQPGGSRSAPSTRRTTTPPAVFPMNIRPGSEKLPGM